MNFSELISKLTTKTLRPKLYSIVLYSDPTVYLWSGLEYTLEGARSVAMKDFMKLYPNMKKESIELRLFLHKDIEQLFNGFTGVQEPKTLEVKIGSSETEVRPDVIKTTDPKQYKNMIMMEIINKKDVTEIDKHLDLFNEMEVKYMKERIKMSKDK